MPTDDAEDQFEHAIHNPFINVRPLMGEEIKDTQTHFGKGPKNWNHTDDKTYERVCEALYMHSEIDASEIIIKVDNGTVTLSGSVPDYHTKWAAEDCVADLPGVWEVKNELRSKRG